MDLKRRRLEMGGLLLVLLLQTSLLAAVDGTLTFFFVNNMDSRGEYRLWNVSVRQAEGNVR